MAAYSATVKGIKSVGKKLGGGGSIVSGGFFLWDAFSTYQEERRQNPQGSTLAAAGKAALTMAAWELPFTRPFMWAAMLADVGEAVGGAAVSLYYQGLANRKGYYAGNFGGRFHDNEIRATMRQRGLAAIQESRLNARTILGSEARALHRGRA